MHYLDEKFQLLQQKFHNKILILIKTKL